MFEMFVSMSLRLNDQSTKQWFNATSNDYFNTTVPRSKWIDAMLQLLDTIEKVGESGVQSQAKYTHFNHVTPSMGRLLYSIGNARSQVCQ